MSSPPPTAPPPTFREAIAAWTRVALLSFGGPVGQIAVMHRILVEEKKWFGEKRFLHALDFCMLLPGPEAQQLATYLGWLLHGWRGGLAAGALFVLPGFLAILGLSLAYVRFHGTVALEALFFGLKAAVMAVVVDALIRIGRRALRGRKHLVMAVAAFIAIGAFGVPFAWIVVLAAACGFLAGRGRGVRAPVERDDAEREDSRVRALGAPSWLHTVAVLAGGVVVWWLPVLVAALALGGSHVLVRIGVFFSQVALLTFGGAYAVLAYVAEQAVGIYGWLSPGEMLDGLGLAETTPGPLIMVVQFVAFLAGFRDHGPLDPTGAAILASCMATWVTFVPSFMWIFAGAPHIERLRRVQSVANALASVTAAVVGVIAHLALWFAVHVLFATATEVRFGPVRATLPDWTTIDFASLAIAIGTLLLLRHFRWGLLRALALGCAAGVLWRMLGA